MKLQFSKKKKNAAFVCRVSDGVKNLESQGIVGDQETSGKIKES